MNVNNSKRSLMAFVLCASLILVLCFSYLYIVTHNNHHCSGHECPVCEQIQIAEHMIEQIKNAMITIDVIFMVAFFVCHLLEMTYVLLEKDSPVKRKVRLNN